MLFRTHLAFGALLAVMALSFFHEANLIIIIAGIALGSVLPDIDTMYSWMGKNLRPFSRVFSTIFGHRTIFHSILLPLAIYIAFAASAPKFTLGFFAGYAGHILMDALTKKGVRPFWPFGLKIKGPIITGSLWEILLFFLLAGVSLLILVLGF